ncbi:hypothetical protein P7K49_029365, partial [Saguinus oedipus]
QLPSSSEGLLKRDSKQRDEGLTQQNRGKQFNGPSLRPADKSLHPESPLMMAEKKKTQEMRPERQAEAWQVKAVKAMGDRGPSKHGPGPKSQPGGRR